MSRSLHTLLAAIVVVFALQSIVADAALVQYWTFDDGAGTTAANEVGTGNTGTLQPGLTPTWITSGLAAPLTARTPNPSTAALDFTPAAPDYVNGGVVGLSSIGSGGDVTLSMWIRPDAASSDMRLYSQLGGAVGNGGATRLNSGLLEMWTGAAWVPLGATFTTGAWNHLAIVWNNGSVQAYFNGVAAGSGTSDFDFATDGFGIGARFLNTFGTGYHGAIDDVALWDEALSPTIIGFLAAGNDPLQPIPVPEPSTSALLLLGIAALLPRRAKR